ncbi:hypothetical protein VTH06DRAFT_5792 [Thermothelomyces fergusii]
MGPYLVTTFDVAGNRVELRDGCPGGESQRAVRIVNTDRCLTGWVAASATLPCRPEKLPLSTFSSSQTQADTS